MRCLLAVAAGLFLIGIPLAADHGNGKGKAKGRYKDHGGPSVVAVDIFVGHDQRIVGDFLTGRPGSGLPPGLAKRGGDLPPGLMKQLYRKGHLPPGLEKKMYPFPVEVERRLSPLSPGLSRGYIDGRAVIYNRKTSAILDVFVPLD
jgi:hypothetical protein